MMQNNEYLGGTSFVFHEKKGMFHANSDTELLGKFLHIKHTDTVLDVGTNNGALLLYASRFHPASLYGIDLFEEVLDTARNNLSLNHVQAELSCCRMQDFQHDPFSVILINPPYFSTRSHSMKKENPYLAAARHDDNLPLEDLFSSTDRLLKDNGKLFLVHRASMLQPILTQASLHQLKCVRMRFAHPNDKSCAESVCFEMQKGRGAQLTVEKPAFLFDRHTF